MFYKDDFLKPKVISIKSMSLFNLVMDKKFLGYSITCHFFAKLFNQYSSPEQNIHGSFFCNIVYTLSVCLQTFLTLNH